MSSEISDLMNNTASIYAKGISHDADGGITLSLSTERYTDIAISLSPIAGSLSSQFGLTALSESTHMATAEGTLDDVNANGDVMVIDGKAYEIIYRGIGNNPFFSSPLTEFLLREINL